MLVRFAIILFVAPTLGTAVWADLVAGAVIVAEGDVIGPSTVSTLNAPFTDGAGNVGFVGALADSQRFVWWKSGPVFLSGSAGTPLTGGESTMGISDTAGFIYSPSADGNDAVYTHGGLLLAAQQPIPALPGLYSRFNSRPTMLPNGTAYWIGGSDDTPTGSTSNRHFFKATDPTNPASIVAVLSGGDVIEGKAIETSASNFDYWVSNNDAHHIHVLDMATGSSANDIHVYVDGAFVAQEGSPTGQGDNWAGFDAVAINNAGNYVITGDTSGDTASDVYVAYNGIIGVREGDTLDGVQLLSGYSIRAASINDLDQVVHMWGSSSDEHLFFGPGDDLASSIHLLGTGDELDVNGDGVADYTVSDFGASASVGPGLDLAEDGYVYLEVNLLDNLGVESGAIIRLVVPEPASLGLLALAGVLMLRRR